MNNSQIQELISKGIIEEPFDYSFLDNDLKSRYDFFSETFQKLYLDKAELFKIQNPCFIIKNAIECNAFAKNEMGYNIIGITQGYVKFMTDTFNQDKFKNILFIALKADQTISNAYALLYEIEDFDFNMFMFNCSIQFTFGHEFQHILQLNSHNFNSESIFNENWNKSKFDINRHAWEFDADRFGSFDTLKYIHQIKNENKIQNDNIFKCMLFLGLGSIFISKLLFYFRITNSTEIVEPKPFYTKEFSHPHPIIRIFNILEYYKDCIDSLFPNLNIEIQDLLNHSLAIVDNYLNSLFPGRRIIKSFFNDLDIHLDEINNYNNELYDICIKDESIKRLLISRNINF